MKRKHIRILYMLAALAALPPSMAFPVMQELETIFQQEGEAQTGGGLNAAGGYENNAGISGNLTSGGGPSGSAGFNVGQLEDFLGGNGTLTDEQQTLADQVGGLAGAGEGSFGGASFWRQPRFLFAASFLSVLGMLFAILGFAGGSSGSGSGGSSLNNTSLLPDIGDGPGEGGNGNGGEELPNLEDNGPFPPGGGGNDGRVPDDLDDHTQNPGDGVSDTSIPEPSTFFLLGAGLFLLQKRRKDVPCPVK